MKIVVKVMSAWLCRVVTNPEVDAIFIQVDNSDGTPMRVHASNNIVAGTKQPIFVAKSDLSSAIVSGSNNWLSTGADPHGLVKSTFGSDPGFTDPQSFDFSLAPGSGCIGTADEADRTAPPTAEYYRNEVTVEECRPRKTARDVGAFEHTTVGPGIDDCSPQ